MASSTDTNAGALKRKRDFLDEEELSDIIIKFGDKQVFAHKIILANSSPWFEKALLGGFSCQDAKKKVVELHDDVISGAMMAMLKHLYGMTYHEQEYPGSGRDLPEFHLDVFILGDKYDVPSLRLAARKTLLEFMSKEFKGPILWDPSIFVIQKLLGPDAAQLVDRSLELHIEERVLSHARLLLLDDTFRSELVRGKMLKPSIADVFMKRIVQAL
ncbi:hypothetical protein D6C81_08190 [Aureobasidium pullulans]|nr:hypothetical protein D6C81_08190 [Aureobasidium pullulans]